jgi:hypothetical protein
MDIVLPYVVTEFLYRSGRLKRDELLRMSDEQLEERIAEFCGVELIELRKVAPAEMKNAHNAKFDTLALCELACSKLFFGIYNDIENQDWCDTVDNFVKYK